MNLVHTNPTCVQHVPRYLMSSLLDETIEAVASGLSTAVYQRPTTPRAPAKRRRKASKPGVGWRRPRQVPWQLQAPRERSCQADVGPPPQ